MSKLIAISIIFSCICFIIYVQVQINKGKLKRADTYSYADVFSGFVKSVFVILILTLLIYVLTNSLEVTITLGIFFLTCAIAGHVFAFFLEYQIKSRGGQKE